MYKFSSKRNWILLLSIFVFASLGISGCASNENNSSSKKFNFGGLITHESNSYSPIETGTLRLTSDDLLNRRDHQGGKTTLLWGLFTYTDY